MVSEDSSSQSNNNNSNNILHEFVSSSQFGSSHHFDGYSTSSLPLNIHSLSERMSRSIDIVRDPHLIDLLGKASSEQSSQKLSLSLGSAGERGLMMSEMGFDEYCWPAQPFMASIGNSRYLQAAQSLLQEMLSVGGECGDKSSKQQYTGRRFLVSARLKAELSTYELHSDKHGDYVNLLKLIALLEEVERRYEDYCHHMEDLVRSFEAIAGIGAGKSYTALALVAMSKHFCRLRNAIVAQIHVTKQKIAKDVPKISSRLCQLSLFEQEARLHRANSVQAWRPLRGLPETSVTILRAWLFEHFLHPYPNDSEKLMLASQTGLSKNQVSNWFINARVRLWKPMIEEMYKEEFEDQSSTESDQLLTNTSTHDLGDS